MWSRSKARQAQAAVGLSLVDLALRATKVEKSAQKSGGESSTNRYDGILESDQHVARLQRSGDEPMSHDARSSPQGRNANWIDEVAEQQQKVDENRNSAPYKELHRNRLASAELGLYGGEYGWQRATRDVVDPENSHLRRFWIKDPIYSNLDAASYRSFRREGFLHIDMRKLLKFSREQPPPPTIFDEWIGQRVPLDDNGCAALMRKCYDQMVKLEGCQVSDSQSFFWKTEELFERMLVTTIPPVDNGPSTHAEFIRVCAHSKRWKEGKIVVDRAMEEVRVLGADGFRLNSAFYEATLTLCANCDQAEVGLQELMSGIRSGVRLTSHTLDCALYLLGNATRHKLASAAASSSEEPSEGRTRSNVTPLIAQLNLYDITKLANDVWALYELYSREKTLSSFKNKIRWGAICEDVVRTLSGPPEALGEGRGIHLSSTERTDFLCGFHTGTFVTEVIRTINEADAAEVKLDVRTFGWLLHALRGNQSFTRYVVGLVPELDARGLGTNTEVFIQLFQYAASIGSGEVALKLHSQRLSGAGSELDQGRGDVAKTTRDKMTEEMLYFMLLAFTKSHQTVGSQQLQGGRGPDIGLNPKKVLGNQRDLDATYCTVALESLNVLEKHSSRVKKRQPLLYYCFLCLCARTGQVETALTFMKRYFLTLDLAGTKTKAVTGATDDVETNLNTNLLTLLLVANLNAFRSKLGRGESGTPAQLSFLQSILIEVLDLWAAVDSIATTNKTAEGDPQGARAKPSLQAVHTLYNTLACLGDSGDLEDLLSGTSLADWVKTENIHLFSSVVLPEGDEDTADAGDTSQLNKTTRSSLELRQQSRQQLLEILASELPSLPPLPELSNLDPECLPTFTTQIHYSPDEIWLKSYGQVNGITKKRREPVDVTAAMPFKSISHKSLDERKISEMPWGVSSDILERAERVIHEGEKKQNFKW